MIINNLGCAVMDGERQAQHFCSPPSGGAHCVSAFLRYASSRLQRVSSARRRTAAGGTGGGGGRGGLDARPSTSRRKTLRQPTSRAVGRKTARFISRNNTFPPNAPPLSANDLFSIQTRRLHLIPPSLRPPVDSRQPRPPFSPAALHVVPRLRRPRMASPPGRARSEPPANPGAPPSTR